MTGSSLPELEEAQFFDDAFRRSGDSLQLKAGTNLYHGWQGGLPNWHDQGALWLTNERERAESYRSWGLPHGRGSGVATFEVVDDLVLQCADMDGLVYLKRFSRTGHHEEFAAKLHGWAMVRRIDAIYEGAGQYIFFRPATLLRMVENENINP